MHRSLLDKHETRYLVQELRNAVGAHVYPVHRLDKPTSGVILFALQAEWVVDVQEQMQNNTAVKEYLLVCRGFCPETGRIDHPLKPINDFKKKSLKQAAEKPAQKAVTDFDRLALVTLDEPVDKSPSARYSLVKAKLLTGRKHQLRRHFKHISHPIIGCPKYGKSVHNRFFCDKLSAPGLLLHSFRMSFIHPVSGSLITMNAPLQEPFACLVERFGWQQALADA